MTPAPARAVPRAPVPGHGLAALALLALVAAGCGADAPLQQAGGSTSAAPAVPTPYEIAIEDAFRYQPPTVTVAAGSTVEVVNQAEEAHSVTADAGAPASFDTGLLAAGDTGQFRLTAPGRYPYHCSRHPDLMHGVIVVQ